MDISLTRQQAERIWNWYIVYIDSLPADMDALQLDTDTMDDIMYPFYSV